MKARYFYNFLAVAGILATIATCYWFYDYNERKGLSSVLVWGLSPILIFVLVTSVVQLVRRKRPKG